MSTCSCGGTRLIFACSGCSDVGEIADKVSRLINKRGLAKMSCLAGVGAGLSGFVESAKGACGNVTIDGCGVACSKKTLENIGITPRSFVLTEMGLEKGKTSSDESTVETVMNNILKDLN